MCGVTGFLLRAGLPADEAARRVTAMASAMQHRGPDDAGAWVDDSGRLALAHRRLSILDLSPAGHQPMLSHGGRFAITFNGEIYNHQELRAKLERAGTAPLWRGHSDTETLLECFQRFGIAATLSETVGMFAIAVWDRRERTLHLARDRFGEKPLYYGWAGGAFVFGSELKAIRQFESKPLAVCREAVAQYLRFMYVPAPRSIYQGVYKLEPGCVLSLRGEPPAAAPVQPLRPGQRYETVSIERWWSLAEQVERGAREPLLDETEAVELLEMRLREAVRLQSTADVPLGAFLSGGVDSSTIVALMQQQTGVKVRTFTIGFEDPAFDESVHARAVARHLGTDHSELRVTAADALAVIPTLPRIYDEPFADSSQIPTHLVCRAARQHATVALSGDAGDELFGGYNRYFWAPRVWDRVGWLPFQVRRSLGHAIRAIPVSGWDAANVAAGRILPRLQKVARAGDKAHKLAARLNTVRDREDLYLTLVSEWPRPGELLRDGVQEPASLLGDPLPAAGMGDERLRMMYRDALTYLPDDILCKVDRASMAISLETRAPFLDHRVAELAWQLPLSMKVRGMQGKWALRKVLHKYVPRELIERPKAGFGIPIGAWLRGPLRGWAANLLDSARLHQDGLFEVAPIARTWREHLAGRHDWTHRLWSILMFQAWLEENR